MIEPLSTQKEYFAKLYQDSTDPFRNWMNDYEVNKRRVALSLLSKRRYSKIFEPGCGNGGLSKELATIADQVLAVDWSREALAAARLYFEASHVQFREMDFPNQLPDQRQGYGTYDLMMVSEVLYYLSPPNLQKFFEAVPKVLQQGGEIMLIHWRGLSTDYPSNGDAVHQAFHQHPQFEMLQFYEDKHFLISSGKIL